MGGQKQNKKDFQKVKLKVGRTVNRGLNFTDTSFKSKKIVLRTQLKEGSRDIKDQFQSCIHKINSTNLSAVIEGLQSLNRIISQMTADRRQTALKHLGILASHSEVQIRMGATTIMNKILDSFTVEQRGAFADSLILNLQSSLTSLDWAVKVDSLTFVNMLLKHIPAEVSQNNAVLENVMDLVSSTKEDLSGRRLSVDLRCNRNHVKVWADVCDVLAKMIQHLMKTFCGDGKTLVKSCNGMTSTLSRVRWFTRKVGIDKSVVQLKGNAVANDILPVLLEMWSGVENFESTSGSERIKFDSFAKISQLMLTVTEWADMSQGTDFKTLPEQALNFFKGRYPLVFENNACSSINLRIAKFLITIHEGKNSALNKTLFVELKKSPMPSDVKLLLDVASKAMNDSPQVLEYVNALFFTKKGQLRRPFYSFYLKACNEVIGDFHMNQMLLKMPSFISKIILQYPTMCSDEIQFLECLHSLMLPAYIDGIGSLSLSTLEQLLRICHDKSRLALRMILDQSQLKGEHLKIILDFWYEGQLSPDDILFVVGHLYWKLNELWFNVVQEPGNQIAVISHIEHVNLMSEFCLSVYLDLDEHQRPRNSEPHHMQPKMNYFQLIHDSSLHLKSVADAHHRMFSALRRSLLESDRVRQRVIELIWALMQAWEYAAGSLRMTSLTLSNILLLMTDLRLFGEDIIDPFDKLVNQLVVTQFLLQSPDHDVLTSCAEYFKVYGIDSFMHDLDQVMNANPQDCDDKLHTAFAKSAKTLRDLKLLPRDELHLDHIEDAMRLAEEVTDESHDSRWP